MQRSLFSFFTVLAFGLLASPALASEEYDGKVLVLGEKSFDDAIKKHPLIMVEFYAPWCGHCKALAPEYAKAAEELTESNIPLAKVDCTVEGEVCNKVGVQGYPTIKVYREGTASDYSKARKADAIVSYLKKQTEPAVTEITEKNIKDFQTKDKVVVIGYFDGAKSAPYETFKSVANKLRDDFAFGAVTDVAIAKEEGVEAPTIVLYKDFDEKKNVFPDNVQDAFKIQDGSVEDKLTTDAITKFIQVNSVPLMNDIGPENYAKYVESSLPLAYLFIENDEQRKEFGPGVEAVARKFRGKVNFVYIDANQFGGHAKNLNLNETWPAFAVEYPASHTKYPLDQETKLTEENVSKLIEEILSGKAKPSIKSAPIPEKNFGPVKIVVADSLKDIALDKEKDVLLEFYAPWCGHCKRLTPIYESLAERFANISSVVIAKMDATENDVPPGVDIVIEGFPTIKLFKAKTNEVVDYSGDRTEDSFVEFLKENAAISFDVPEAVASDDKEKDDKEKNDKEEDDKEKNDNQEHDEL